MKRRWDNLGKYKDISGKRFGNWTVLSKTDEVNSAGQILWLCRCDCGTERKVSGTYLRTGISKSCGCSQRKAVSQDIIGQRFGNLVVNRSTNRRSPDGGIIWDCICDCGNHKYANNRYLKYCSLPSCGCTKAPYKDLSGMKFNMLTAIEPTHKRQGSAHIWKCICDCGNICEISSANLQNGHTKSCGCLMSYGEQVIGKMLQDNDITFERQKQFDDCRFEETGSMAKFDFYINDEYLLEYDGIQHFRYDNNGWHTESNVASTKKRDRYKDEWCKNHSIPLIRIPYTRLNDLCVDDLLLHKSRFVVN